MIEQYISLTHDQREKFELLYNLVLNSSVNLTAIKEKADFFLKHILDSVYFFLKRPLKINSLVDAGSGGGFPGLVLAIYFRDWQVTLVDSNGKKCRFLNEATNKLQLTNVHVVYSRAEDMAPAGYDLVTVRGVGSVKELLKYTMHLVHDKGAWLMYKGERLGEELAEAKPITDRRGIKSETVRVETPFTRSYLYLYY